jgi:hypothetical protein
MIANAKLSSSKSNTSSLSPSTRRSLQSALDPLQNLQRFPAPLPREVIAHDSPLIHGETSDDGA